MWEGTGRREKDVERYKEALEALKVATKIISREIWLYFGLQIGVRVI